MTRRQGLFAMVGSLLGGFLAACGASNPKYRFRLAVQFKALGATVSGSTVFEVETIGSRDMVYGGKGARTRVRGEAATLKMPDGTHVFAIMRTIGNQDGDVAEMSMKALDPTFNFDRIASAKNIANGNCRDGKIEILGSERLMIVRFSDVNEPSTVSQLTERETPELSMYIECTTDPIAGSIDIVLPWLKDYYAKRLDGKKIGDASSFANALTSADFSTELVP